MVLGTGASSMYQSVVINHSIVTLENIDKFVDGASVARVGDITFDIAKDKVDDYVQVDGSCLLHNSGYVL